MMANEKRCSKCHVVYPPTLEYFHKDVKGANGLSAQCKECRHKAAKQRTADGYKAPGREETLREYSASKKGAATQRRYRRTPGGKALSRRAKLSYYYNITDNDYNEMFEAQEGRCAICGTHQSKLKRRLSVDHNHGTEVVRTLLCDGCNRHLGRFERNGNRYNQYLTEKFVNYLKTYDSNFKR